MNPKQPARQPQPQGGTAVAKPSPHELREHLANEGNFAALLDEILRSPRGVLDLRHAFGQLRTATRVAAAGDPATFCDQLFREALSLSTYVLLRVQYAAARALDGADAALDRPYLPPEFSRELLPQLHEVQGQIRELAQAWAATTRLWGLADRRRQAAAPAKRRGGPGRDDGKAGTGPRLWEPGRGRLGDLLDNNSPN
jgi:hypothetical protein